MSELQLCHWIGFHRWIKFQKLHSLLTFCHRVRIFVEFCQETIATCHHMDSLLLISLLMPFSLKIILIPDHMLISDSLGNLGESRKSRTVPSRFFLSTIFFFKNNYFYFKLCLENFINLFQKFNFSIFVFLVLE